MSGTTIQKKIRVLEAEVKALKTAAAKRPDFSVDEKNWQKVKSVSKKVRAKLFKARYA